MNTQETDIVVNAANAGNFVILSNALKAAGLVGALKGIGPFTFFAPTDDAFKKLPAGALEKLLKDREKLAAIINAHVMQGAVLANDIKNGDSPSLQGQALKFKTTDTGFTVNGAKVSRNEIEACNGVIHPIDTVMMPA
ncbi:MAG TPA: fasciclin domain-containing protein [Usitatibacter sp.]